MAAYCFLCDAGTEQECLDRLLFGTNEKGYSEYSLSNVQEGDSLFLWNYDTGVLRGPFVALTKCEANIEPNAWKNAPGHGKGFPFQVRVSGNEEYGTPLDADDIQQAGLLHQTKLGLMPPASPNSAQVHRILEMFREKNEGAGPPVLWGDAPVVAGTDNLLDTAFIFKCDKVTGGRCFSANIMGAPVQLFRDLVSNVQRGATIFLWQIEERKLFGVWRAKERGQYDPTAFGESAEKRLHAVVYCDRKLDLQIGIDETALRGIVPYDGNMPPYRIGQTQAEKLTDALIAANSAGDSSLSDWGAEEKYLAEDGHYVRSRAELIIDNMLYSQRCIHAYEKRVQVGDRYLRCDFYLPSSLGHEEVYVEYWGMLHDPEYAARRQQKLKLYGTAGITPLELFPKDLSVLSEVWPAKLARYDT